MCTTTCRTATWARCRCECDYANHGMSMMTPLAAPVPRRLSAGRRGGSGQDQAGPSNGDPGAQLFGVDLLHIESWLDDHPVFRDEVAHLVHIAGSPEESAGGNIESHLACTVLVSVVMALESVDLLREHAVDGIAGTLSDAAMASVRVSLGSETSDQLEPHVAAVLAHVVDAALPGLALVDPEVLIAARVAAVLACPDPDEHAEVVDHCVHPLVTTVIDGSGLVCGETIFTRRPRPFRSFRQA